MIKILYKYILEISVFVCGAVVMVYELAGSRVLAPYLGTSIYVWTSLIGVILGSLSLGYWLGGKLADRKPEYKFFSFIIFLSALCIGVTVVIKDIVLIMLEFLLFRIELNSLLVSFILFAPASILLGMISPYSVRLKIKDLNNSATTVGNLYAISTVGSIIGTLAAGFFIIPFLGTTKILILLCAILVATSLLAYSKHLFKIKFLYLALFVLAVLPLNSKVNAQPNFLDINTQYNRIWIYKDIDTKTNKPRLSLSTNPYGTQCAMYLDDEEPVFEYTKYYRLAKHFKPDLGASLMIGGCAYSYPKDYLNKFPNATLDVVEIDPMMTTLAKKYFRLKENPRLKIFHEDGRTFLNTTKSTYDVIFGDAFNSFTSIPHQLTTKETVQKKYDLLRENGVVILNIISAINGVRGKFLRAEYQTYKSIFPQVYVFPVTDMNNGEEVQNIILVAMKSNVIPTFTNTDPELNQYLGHLWKHEIPNDVPILTDDFAPVEYYKYISLE